MAYDEGLADRVRDALPDDAPVVERKMFGGLAFLRNGNMFCGIVHDALMLRLGPDGAPQALAEAHVRPMDFTGRPMQGMVFVDPGSYQRFGPRGAAFLQVTSLLRLMRRGSFGGRPDGLVAGWGS